MSRTAIDVADTPLANGDRTQGQHGRHRRAGVDASGTDIEARHARGAR